MLELDPQNVLPCCAIRIKRLCHGHHTTAGWSERDHHTRAGRHCKEARRWRCQWHTTKASWVRFLSLLCSSFQILIRSVTCCTIWKVSLGNPVFCTYKGCQLVVSDCGGCGHTQQLDVMQFFFVNDLHTHCHEPKFSRTWQVAFFSIFSICSIHLIWLESRFKRPPTRWWGWSQCRQYQRQRYMIGYIMLFHWQNFLYVHLVNGVHDKN